MELAASQRRELPVTESIQAGQVQVVTSQTTWNNPVHFLNWDIIDI